MRAFPSVLALALLAACGAPGPTPIRYGEAACEHCHMTASDPRFGAELVTTTGKAYVFDAIECLAEYVADHPEMDAQTHALWVTAFDDPGTLIPLDDAYFVQAPGVRSPMGMNLAAFARATSEAEARAAFDGAEILTWADVRALTDADPLP